VSDYAALASHLYPYLRDMSREGVGTAFPSSPQTSDRYFRSDLNLWCVYDGTRWITVQNAPVVLVPNRTTISANTIWDTRVRTDYALYVEAYAISTSTAATNDGTHFWTITCQGVNNALSAATNTFTPNTSADTAATETDHSGNVAAGNVAPANNAYLRVNATKTSTPGNLTLAVTAYCRLIVT
jgi:hypothetical protein